MLLRALIVEQPFDAPYDNHGAAWKACTFTLWAAQDPPGNLVYGPQGVGDKAIKKHFDKYIAYAKKLKAKSHSAVGVMTKMHQMECKH
jgi:hypothetical protein